MKMINKGIYFILILLTSCKPTVDNDVVEVKALNHITNPDNGLIQKRAHSDMNYVLMYRPELLKNDSTLVHYILAVNSQKTGGNKEKSDFYYAYEFEKDIYGIVNQDTLRPIQYILEQGLGGSKQFNINLAFQNTKKEDITIAINDRYGYNNEFHYKKEDLLKFKTQILHHE